MGGGEERDTNATIVWKGHDSVRSAGRGQIKRGQVSRRRNNGAGIFLGEQSH